MDKLGTVETALQECETLMRQNPSAGPFDYVAVQLRYLLNLLKEESNDKSRLKDINIGLIAIREFETRFPEFADRLMKIECIVEDLRYSR
jgi:hypothetical protein